MLTSNNVVIIQPNENVFEAINDCFKHTGIKRKDVTLVMSSLTAKEILRSDVTLTMSSLAAMEILRSDERMYFHCVCTVLLTVYFKVKEVILI